MTEARKRKLHVNRFSSESRVSRYPEYGAMVHIQSMDVVQKVNDHDWISDAETAR